MSFKIGRLIFKKIAYHQSYAFAKDISNLYTCRFLISPLNNSNEIVIKGALPINSCDVNTKAIRIVSGNTKAQSTELYPTDTLVVGNDGILTYR